MGYENFSLLAVIFEPLLVDAIIFLQILSRTKHFQGLNDSKNKRKYEEENLQNRTELEKRGMIAIMMAPLTMLMQ